MLFDKHMNLYHAASHALRPFHAAIRRVKEFGIDNMISDRPHVMLWLFKTYALSAGMFASQIWSMQSLEHDKVLSNPLQVAGIDKIISDRPQAMLWLFKNRNPYNFTGSGQLPKFGIGWLIQIATLYAIPLRFWCF
jgi:hypothetical protein